MASLENNKEREYTLFEVYEELLRVVIRQRKALENDNVKNLEVLSKKKEKYIRILLKMEETIDIEKEVECDERLKHIRERLVEEDRKFIECFRKKEKAKLHKTPFKFTS